MNALSSKATEKFKQFLAIALALVTTVVLSGIATVISANAAGDDILQEGSLIKAPDRPEVYIINTKAHGQYAGWKRHIFNPDVFNMYGHLSWDAIKIVPQSVIDMYETSNLYRADGDPRVYYLKEEGSTAVKYHIQDEAAFNAYGFSWDQVFIVNERERDYYPTGYVITATSGLPGQQNNNNNGGQQGGTTPVGSGLTVSVASDNPVADTILSDDTSNQYPQALIPFLKVNFSAGNDGDVKVTSVSFKRTGIASDSDLGNLYLYDGEMRVAEYTSFSDRVVTFTNPSGLFTVPKGTTKTITLKGDLARGSTPVSASKTIGFDLVSASDVTTDGAAVSGSFPIMGNKMATAQVSDLGYLYIDAYETTNPSSLKGDATNQELWRFSLISGNQDMEVRKIKLTMVGTISPTDIQNLKLEVGGVQVGSAQAIASDNTVIFDLSSNPIRINSGQTKIVSLKGDMNGGAGRNFYFSIQRSSDVVVYDRGYGVFVTMAKDTQTGAFGIVKPTSATSVDAGTLTLSVATDSPTGNIPASATGVTLAKFGFYASGESVKVDNLSVKCNSSNTGLYIDNVKLLLEGSQVGSTATTLQCNNSATVSFTFGNTFQVPAGTTKYLTIVADTTDSTVSDGNTIAVSLVAGSGNAQGLSTLNSISTTDQTARTVTVKSGAATVAKNTAFGDKTSSNPTGTVNASGVKIGSFVITAGAGEAIDVTQITLADDATTQLGDNFQNLMLKDSNGNQIGSTIATLNTTAGTYTFTPASPIRINAGQQLVVDVFADIKSSAADTGTSLSPVAKVNSVTATGVNTSADASYTTAVNLQTAYIASSGNLTVTTGADTPIAQQLVMGSTDVALATFKLEADAAEDIIISDITVSDQVSSGATGTLKNLKLYVDGVQVGQTVQLSGTDSTSTYANANFSGLNLVIPRNSSKTLTVRADVTSYDDGASAGSTHKIALLVNKGGGSESIIAKGASSGASITGATLDYGTSPDADQTANTMTVYATKVSVAFASDSPSGAAGPAAGAVVMKVVVSNSSNVGNYSATVKLMNFAMNSVGFGTTNTKALTIYKDSIASGNQVATTNYPAGGQVGNSAIEDANFTDVEIAAGSSKTFIVTLDTSEAGATDSLSVGMSQGDLEWRDSKVTNNITTVDSLPLLSKTLTY